MLADRDLVFCKESPFPISYNFQIGKQLVQRPKLMGHLSPTSRAEDRNVRILVFAPEIVAM
jgi:hypothetical protein